MANKSTNVRTFYWYLQPLRAFFWLLSTLAPAVAGRWAMVLFRLPRRHRVPGRERRWLEAARRYEVGDGAERLTAWAWGDGPPVLLMHGWEGRGSQLGAFVEPLTAAGFSVVAVDAPAHGDSPGRLSSLPQFARAVSLAAARFGPLHGVVAHSFGAASAGRAMGAGLAVERLVFLSAPYDLEHYVRYFATLIGLRPRGRAEMISRLERQFDIVWSEGRFATTAHADETPLLVIHDRDDAECPIEDARVIARRWPQARLLETEGLGHRRILRDPRVISWVVDFLATVDCRVGSSTERFRAFPDAVTVGVPSSC